MAWSTSNALNDIKKLREEEEKRRKNAKSGQPSDTAKTSASNSNNKTKDDSKNTTKREWSTKNALEDIRKLRAQRGEISRRFPTVANTATVGDIIKNSTNEASETAEKKRASGWDIAGSTFTSGLATFNKGLASTLDFIMPTEFLGEYDPFSKLNDYYSKEYELWENKRQSDLEGYGDVAKTVSDVGVSAVDALPNALLAIMSGGSSTAAQGASIATQAASNAGASAVISNYLKTAAKDPQTWLSLLRTLGPDYEYAKETGANDFEAVAYAFSTSGLNALIERGSGIETLPSKNKAGSNLFWNWFKSGLEEGGEEIAQKGVSGIMEKSIYNPDKEVFSTTNKDAIINPTEMGKEGAMGMAVGLPQ